MDLLLILLFFFFLDSVSAACLFRYNALSFIYLIYLLLIPLFAEPTSTTMLGKFHCATLCKLDVFDGFGFGYCPERKS